jgi:amino acid adenylation domain-containing protein
MSTPIVTEGYPLSREQRMTWASRRSGRTHPVQAVVSIEGALDLDALANALTNLVDRHEILRTCLLESPTLKAPLQAVDAESAIPVTVEHVDLRGASENERAEFFAAVMLKAEAAVDSTAGLLSVVAAQITAEQTDLVLTFSPFCADIACFGPLVRQLAALYATAIGRDTHEQNGETLGEIVQYADYAAWQEQQLNDHANVDARAHWAGLARASMTTIPCAQAVHEDSGVRVPGRATVVLSSEQMGALKALGAQVWMEPRAVLLAAWAVWIWRVTRENPVVFATVADGREQDADLRRAIGPYLCSLPIAVEITAEDTFVALIARVGEADKRAREHQRGLAHDALPADYDHALLFQMAASDVQADGGAVRMRLAQASTSPLAPTLTLRCVPSADELRLELSHDGHTTGVELATRAAAQLEALLDAVIANPDSGVGKLTLYNSDDSQSSQAVGTITEPEIGRATSIAHAFADQVSRTPERLALVYQDESLTYRQLDARANRLANALLEHGVTVGTLVGVCVERGLDMVVAVLGVLKASAAYVPLDPSTLNPGRPGYPSERLAFMLNDSSVDLLVAHRLLANGLPELSVRVLAMDDPGLLERSSPDPPELLCGPQSLAYAIYTSGSTGRPKAVAIEHCSALNLWAALRRDVYGQHEREHVQVSLNAPLGFDPSVQQMLAMLDGHTVVIVPEHIRADGRALLDLVDRHEVEVWDCTPPQLRLLIDAGLLAPGRLLPKLVLCGGEAIDRSTWAAVAEARGLRAFNLYGPTECTVDSTLAPIRGDRPTIGRPLRNVRAYVLDDSANPVPVGVAGELYIGGAGVARGYLNRPELNIQRFVADRFAGDGSRMYRTGDLVRMEADGTIAFLGRLDGQVKIRSHRIELGEVANALDRCSGVAQSIVTRRKGSDGEARLVAYYIADGESPPTSSDLRATLKEWLPEYMLPSAFVEITSFPLTSNGKIDEHALPEPAHSRPAVNVEFVSPRNAAETQFAQIWGEVLGLDSREIGVLDNFFDDLGGDSLRAVDLVNRLETLVGRELPLDLVVQTPTVQQQAESLWSSP